MFSPLFERVQGQSVHNALVLPPDFTPAVSTDSIAALLKDFPPGTCLSVAFVHGSKTAYWGIRLQNDTLQNTHLREAVFEIGSLTKVFTSALLHTLVQAGKLHLTDTVAATAALVLKDNPPITFQQLSSHTSGLPRLPSGMGWRMLNHPDNPYQDYDSTQLEKYLQKDLQLENTPGTRYAYSNLGAGLLGYALGKIMHAAPGTLFERFLFAPYGMKHTTFDKNKIENLLVAGLDKKGQPTANWNLNALCGAGGLYSNAEDLVRFAQANFDVNNTTLEQQRRPVFSINDKMDIASGWHIIKRGNAGHQHWHNGGTGGYTSCMILDIAQQKGIVILSNVSAFHKKMTNIDQLGAALLSF